MVKMASSVLTNSESNTNQQVYHDNIYSNCLSQTCHVWIIYIYMHGCMELLSMTSVDDSFSIQFVQD